jgi:hypothetical protein
MAADNTNLVTTVSILARRLREGKRYGDFRKAWFHTTGFGVEGKDAEGSSNRMYSLVNVFDPREIIVLGFATTTLEQPSDALEIDVSVRGANPLDDVIEPEIGRKFAALVAEDDFSAAGHIPCCPPMTGGKVTDIEESVKTLRICRRFLPPERNGTPSTKRGRRSEGPVHFRQEKQYVRSQRDTICSYVCQRNPGKNISIRVLITRLTREPSGSTRTPAMHGTCPGRRSGRITTTSGSRRRLSGSRKFSGTWSAFIVPGTGLSPWQSPFSCV